ncbi:MAG: hypothetical protein ACUVT7_05300 [Thermoplasmata archaeon]
MLALVCTVALAVVGVAPDGGHLWIESIQNAMKSTVSSVAHPTGGHLWIE